jgi:hypothetical protein
MRRTAAPPHNLATTVVLLLLAMERRITISWHSARHKLCKRISDILRLLSEISGSKAIKRTLTEAYMFLRVLQGWGDPWDSQKIWTCTEEQ